MRLPSGEVFCAVLVGAVSLTPSPTRAAHQYFAYFHQRTTYLESPTVPGAWWSNPALACGDTSVTFMAENVAPLGGRFLMAEGRLLVPVFPWLALGIGLLGAGDYESGSSGALAEERGFSYESHFAFERPRLQLCGAVSFGPAGAYGLLFTVGTDGRSVVADSTEGVGSPGLSVGWLSPELRVPLRLSVSLAFVHHSLDYDFWDRSGKLALILLPPKGLVEASLEYTFTLGHGFGVLTPDESDYDVVKFLASVRVYRTIAVLAGYSTDLRGTTGYYNGRTIHLGAEMRPASASPFVGGYDLGFHPGWDWRVAHRVWFGYRFGALRTARPPAAPAPAPAPAPRE